MADEQNAELHHLRIRVDELEKSNQALWAWMKALASQDSMLLQSMYRLFDKSDDWVVEREKIMNQIIDNNRSINNLPVPEDE